MLRTERLRDRATTTVTALRSAVLDWRPLGLAALCIMLTILVAQLPLRYSFGVGVERGPNSDEPFLQSFYPTEGEWPDHLFRWSRTEYATIEVPGLGRRGVIADLQIISHQAQHHPERGTTRLTLRPDGGIPLDFTLRREPAHYLIFLPPEALPAGSLHMRVETPTWQNDGDSRDEIGVALAGQVRVQSIRPTQIIWPDLRLLLGLSSGVLLAWGSVRMAGFARQRAAFLIVPLALILPLLSVLDPARVGYLGAWLPAWGLLLLGGVAASLLLIPAVLHIAASPLPVAALRWLALLAALTFALKYGGRLYPDAMPGDWQLHINRFGGTVKGDLTILARHRGLPFPFPQGYYLDIAPLIVSGIDIRPVLPLLAGFFEAASIPVIYAIVVRTSGGVRLGLLAAATYALTATGFMNTWFSFHTQVSTQFFTALLILVLVAAWPNYRDTKVWWSLAFILSQQFLGHIGTFINAGLLGVLVIAALLVRARSRSERRAALALLGVGLAVAAFVTLFYYSSFTGQILEQVSGVASRGLVGVSGKKPLAADVYLRTLWDGGLITHYGFFPVVLAIPGAVALAQRRPRGPLVALLLGTIAVSCGQAILPLLTQSAIMTRWLTFAAWAVAVAGGMGLLLWWRRGPAARLAAIAMACYVVWITAVIVAEAMTQRLPPIEPF